MSPRCPAWPSSSTKDLQGQRKQSPQKVTKRRAWRIATQSSVRLVSEHKEEGKHTMTGKMKSATSPKRRKRELEVASRWKVAKFCDIIMHPTNKARKRINSQHATFIDMLTVYAHHTAQVGAVPIAQTVVCWFLGHKSSKVEG